MAHLSLLLAFSLWLPAVCGGGFTVQSTLSEPSEEPAPTHTPSPDSGYRDTPTTAVSSQSEQDPTGLNFLGAAFFFIAAGWLVLALLYSVLVLIVVRLRARGQLDVYDENFGRFYLLGTRCYIPLGCVLRRYVIALNHEENAGGDPATVRLMTREERRMAVELLLASDEENVPISGDSVSTSENNEEEVVLSNETDSEEIGHADQFAEAKIEEEHGMDDASSDEPVCTICLAEYGMWFTRDLCLPLSGVLGSNQILLLQSQRMCALLPQCVHIVTIMDASWIGWNVVPIQNVPAVGLA